MDILNIDRVIKRFPKTYEFEMEEILPFIADSSFLEADRIGLEYYYEKKLGNTNLAPFCLDKIKRANVRVIVKDELKQIIDLMKKLAIDESDKKGSKGSQDEAAFTFVGRKKGNKILINDAFWDESGFKNNRLFSSSVYDEYGDGDSWYFNILNEYNSTGSVGGNVTTLSNKYIEKQDKICKKAKENEDGTLVVINGHTHPQNMKFKKVNNYPSRDDIVKSISEAVNYFEQRGGNCIYLNAIINADGDLNIFGLDITQGKFLAYDNIVYKNSCEHIASLTDGNYPIQKTKK